MSGSSIPYHLRPHKAVDRRIFLDLLRIFERWRPLQNDAYVSMGAYPLEDHRLVHRLLGIKQLLAFDMDEEVVARQKFNRPIEMMQCIKMTSGDLVKDFETVLDGCNYTYNGVVVWLDYTSPKEIGEQLREFSSLISKLRPGDVVRITVNAHPEEERPRFGGKPKPAEQRRDQQFQLLKEKIADYLPSRASSDDMTTERLPKVLAGAIADAALKAIPVSGTSIFAPLSIIRYADGQQMLSVTGTIAEKAKLAEMRKTLEVSNWQFMSPNWTTIHHLVVPDLTLRERLFLERIVGQRTDEEIIEELGFKKAGEIDVNSFLKSYRAYYRFYPTLLAADL